MHLTQRKRAKTAAPRAEAPARKGVVILAVLIVLVILGLIGYQYHDLMTNQYREANAFRRSYEVRGFAESGVHYAMALLADPVAFQETLGGNPFNNPNVFLNVSVAGTSTDPSRLGVFTVLNPISPEQAAQEGTDYFLPGVADESAKINPNAVMRTRNGAKNLLEMLKKLPNMTEDVAAAIVDWLDKDDTPREAGAENEFYSILIPPYRTKNGPIDSLDELLMVRGITPEILFGQDKNRNGVIDPEEEDGSGLGLGLSAYLTVYSRELSIDSELNPRITLNATMAQTDLMETFYPLLAEMLGDEELTTFICMYRVYGGTTTLPEGQTALSVADFDINTLYPSSGSGGTTSATTGATGGSTGATGGTLKNISTLYDLFGYVVVPAPANTDTGGTTGGTTGGASGGSGSGGTTGGGGGKSSGGGTTGGTTTTTNTTISVSGAGMTIEVQQTTTTTQAKLYYASPLLDGDRRQALAAVLFDKLTTAKPPTQTATTSTDDPLKAYQGPLDLYGRVNVNTATREVLLTLPGLTEDQVDEILNARPPLVSSEPVDPIFTTPAWLITVLDMPVATVKSLDKYITARSQVYRMQVLGYFEQGTGHTVRLEAVIDTNGGKPRIMHQRDLTELGRGFDVQVGGGG